LYWCSVVFRIEQLMHIIRENIDPITKEIDMDKLIKMNHFKLFKVQLLITMMLSLHVKTGH
jgi:hypothetical protein